MAQHAVTTSRRRYVQALTLALTVSLTSTAVHIIQPAALAHAETSSGKDISHSNGVTFSNIKFFVNGDKEKQRDPSQPLGHNDRFYATISGKSAAKGDTITFSLGSDNNTLFNKYVTSDTLAEFSSDFTGVQNLRFNDTDEVGAQLRFDGKNYIVKFLKDIDDFHFDVASSVRLFDSYGVDSLPEVHSEKSTVNLVIGPSSSQQIQPTPYFVSFDLYKKVASDDSPKTNNYSPECRFDLDKTYASNSSNYSQVYVSNIANRSDSPKMAKIFLAVDGQSRPLLVKEYRAHDNTDGVLSSFYPKESNDSPTGTGASKNPANGETELSIFLYDVPKEYPYSKEKLSGGSTIYKKLNSPKIVTHDGLPGYELNVLIPPHQIMGSLGAFFIAPYKGRVEYHSRCLVDLVDPGTESGPFSEKPYFDGRKTETSKDIPGLIFGSERISEGPIDSTLNNPKYENAQVYRNDVVTLTPFNQVYDDPDGFFNGVYRDLPSGMKYSLGSDAPDWVSIDPNTGVITGKPGVSVDLGAHEFTVKAVMPDDSVFFVPTSITVKSIADKFKPEGSRVSVRQSQTATLAPPTGLDGAGKVKFSYYDGKKVLDFTTLKEDGSVVVSPTTQTRAQSWGAQLTVTYEDGSTDIVTDIIDVEKIKDSDTHDLTYPNDHITTIPGGVASTSPVKNFPEGSHFSIPSDVPSFISIDSLSGVVTMRPSTTQTPGDTPVKVTITYPDNSTDVATVVATVVDKNPVTTTVTQPPVTDTVTVTPEPVVTTVTTTPKPVTVTNTTTVKGEPTTVTQTVTPEPVTDTVTVTPEPVVTTVTTTPKPVTVTNTATTTVKSEPITHTLTVTPEPVTVTNTSTRVTTATVTPEPVVTTVTTTPKPVTVTNTTTVKGEPTTVTQTVTPEPVTDTVTVTPEPVVTTTTVKSEPVTNFLTVTPEPVVTTVTQTPAPVTITAQPEPTTVTATPIPDPIDSDPQDGSSDTSSGSSTVGIVASILSVLGVFGIIGWFMNHNPFAPAPAPAPVPEQPAPAAPTVPARDPHEDPEVVVHPDGTVCPANEHIKGVCRKS